MNCSYRDFDYGVDVTVHEIAKRGNRYIESGFKIDIQAKSTINAIFEQKILKYDMEIKTYDDLREPDVGTPRILVLLVLPNSEENWIHCHEKRLALRQCAYWLSLKGREPTKNTDSIRVSIPRTNRFTIEALQQIMRAVRAGEDLS